MAVQKKLFVCKVLLNYFSLFFKNKNHHNYISYLIYLAQVVYLFTYYSYIKYLPIWYKNSRFSFFRYILAVTSRLSASLDHLSTEAEPHPFKVFLLYSHCPYVSKTLHLHIRHHTFRSVKLVVVSSPLNFIVAPPLDFHSAQI